MQPKELLLELESMIATAGIGKQEADKLDARTKALSVVNILMKGGDITFDEVESHLVIARACSEADSWFKEYATTLTKLIEVLTRI